MPPCDSGGGSDKGDADLSASTPDERFSTTGLSELDDPLILIHEVSNLHAVAKVLELALKALRN
uniref:Uncharacterized protein n=1 Tax=Oryza nivara TaxID=4536 RepID=A0A0E0J840_ORYNI